MFEKLENSGIMTTSWYIIFICLIFSILKNIKASMEQADKNLVFW
jgi:hypothetical protein